MFTRALNIQHIVKMGSLVNKTVEVKGNGLTMDVGLVQNKPIGQIIESTQPKSVPKLFTPFTIRDQTFPNRILVIHLILSHLLYECIHPFITLVFVELSDVLHSDIRME